LHDLRLLLALELIDDRLGLPNDVLMRLEDRPNHITIGHGSLIAEIAKLDDIDALLVERPDLRIFAAAAEHLLQPGKAIAHPGNARGHDEAEHTDDSQYGKNGPLVFAE
jgi:hypothetical protein